MVCMPGHVPLYVIHNFPLIDLQMLVYVFGSVSKDRYIFWYKSCSIKFISKVVTVECTITIAFLFSVVVNISGFCLGCFSINPSYSKHLMHCMCIHWLRTRVKARHYSKKLALRGTFFDAKVIRGADWQWENQDGECSSDDNYNNSCKKS